MLKITAISFVAAACIGQEISITTAPSMYSKFFFNPSPPIVGLNGTLIQSAPFPANNHTAPPVVRVGPVARGQNNYNAASLPCCRDRFGEAACQSLSKSQPELFERRCLNDHDFHTLDCCAECRSYIDNHKIQPENARGLFKAPSMCKDKHSLQFCRRFKASGLGKYSCATAEFAVRVCRHTCGYCNDNLYSFNNTMPLCSTKREKPSIF